MPVILLYFTLRKNFHSKQKRKNFIIQSSKIKKKKKVNMAGGKHFRIVKLLI